MKTILLPIVLLLLSITAYSQVKTGSTSPDIPSPSKEQLLAESKAQKKIGKILFWGGVGLVIGGIATYDPYFTPLAGAPEDGHDNSVSAVLTVTGLLSMVGGAVQLANAKSSKKKALSMAVRQEKIPISQQGTFITKATPTIGLQMTF